MNANEVRALVAKKYPSAHTSPLAQMFNNIAASDAADQAIEFAQLQAKGSKAAMKREAYKHAADCIDACDSKGIEYDAETLSFNVECSFPDLTIDECDEAAEMALRNSKGSTP